LSLLSCLDGAVCLSSEVQHELQRVVVVVVFIIIVVVFLAVVIFVVKRLTRHPEKQAPNGCERLLC
jgi:heme/copper-type cytochrome/quinol oxidase subunit 2